MLVLKNKLPLCLLPNKQVFAFDFFNCCFWFFVLLLLVHTQVKQVIDSSDWKMHHNCCSLSSLNYVLLAQEQVNNTSSVYRSDLPCHLNRWLTKERGNPQFADSTSQELANSNYVSKKGSRANFASYSVRLIKGGVAFSARFKIVTFGKSLCMCVWGLCLHCTMSEVSFPGGILLPAVLKCGEEQSTSRELQAHTAFGTPAMRHGTSLGTRGSRPRRVIPSLSPSQGWGALVCSVGLWHMRCSHALWGGWFYFALVFVA